MARFYREYPDIEIVQTLSAQITWSHNLEILRVESKEQRLWYINKTIENGVTVKMTEVASTAELNNHNEFPRVL